ncbi:MAG: hypothetical protein AAB353_02995 [Candidatus Hydrogenedentota bacterium]
MRTRILISVSFAFLLGCVLSAGRISPWGLTGSVFAAPQTPEDVAKAFMEAGDAGNQEAALALMTVKARETMSADKSLSMSAQEFESYSVGKAAITGETADVPVDAVQAGEKQKVTLKMRIEKDAWRVFGVSVEMAEGMAMTIDFENIGDTINQMTEQLTGALEQVGETMQQGLQEAFSGESGGDLATKKAAFEALAPVTEAAYESMWKNDSAFKDKTKLDALNALAAGLGLAVDPGEFADKLASKVDVDVENISRADAIERICASAGLYPVFPDAPEDLGEFGDAADSEEQSSRPAIALAEGPRPYPVAFGGPFVFSVDDLTDNAPVPIGSLTFAVRAYGLDSALLDLLTNNSEATNIERLVGPNGEPLTREDVYFLSGGQANQKVFMDVFNVELVNLVRAVDSVTISGAQSLTIPSSLDEIVFSSLAEGETQEVNGISVEVSSVSENFVQFAIKGPADKIERLDAIFWASDADGNDVEIAGSSADSWTEGEMQATVQTFAPFSSLRMKFLAVSGATYPFELKEIAVPNHDQMPEKIEELSFEGHDAPISVEFVKFLNDDTDFREILVRVTNHANKDAIDVSCNMVYLDRAGDEIDDFPGSLSGEFGADGQLPVAAASATSEVEATAFSAPEKTKKVRVDVQRIQFSDGSTWEAELN